jgi:excisionase family DNA binding protein
MATQDQAVRTKRILRTAEAAVYLGLSVSMIEKMRLRGGGPSFVRLGSRAVWYDISALDAWLEEQRVPSTNPTVR